MIIYTYKCNNCGSIWDSPRIYSPQCEECDSFDVFLKAREEH